MYDNEGRGRQRGEGERYEEPASRQEGGGLEEGGQTFIRRNEHETC